MDDNNKKSKQNTGEKAIKGDDQMSVVVERPNTPLESIEKSMKEIQDYISGKGTMKSLNESKSLWSKWVQEDESK